MPTTWTLPLSPRLAATASCLPFGPIGVTTNGVELFNALDAQKRDAVAHEVQDACGGHPGPNGAYHYHAISPCIRTNGSSTLVGYALDGFGIYVERRRDERRSRRVPRADVDGPLERQADADLPLRRDGGVPVHARLLPRDGRDDRRLFAVAPQRNAVINTPPATTSSAPITSRRPTTSTSRMKMIESTIPQSDSVAISGETTVTRPR